MSSTCEPKKSIDVIGLLLNRSMTSTVAPFWRKILAAASISSGEALALLCSEGAVALFELLSVASGLLLQPAAAAIANSRLPRQVRRNIIRPLRGIGMAAPSLNVDPA